MAIGLKMIIEYSMNLCGPLLCKIIQNLIYCKLKKAHWSQKHLVCHLRLGCCSLWQHSGRMGQECMGNCWETSYPIFSVSLLVKATLHLALILAIFLHFSFACNSEKWSCERDLLHHCNSAVNMAATWVQSCELLLEWFCHRTQIMMKKTEMEALVMNDWVWAFVSLEFCQIKVDESCAVPIYIFWCWQFSEAQEQFCSLNSFSSLTLSTMTFLKMFCSDHIRKFLCSLNLNSKGWDWN